MISTMRPDIDNIDEYVRNTTARAFAVVASALGIPSLLPFLKAVCRSKKSWQARHTGMLLLFFCVYFQSILIFSVSQIICYRVCRILQLMKYIVFTFHIYVFMWMVKKLITSVLRPTNWKKKDVFEMASICCMSPWGGGGASMKRGLVSLVVKSQTLTTQTDIIAIHLHYTIYA